MSDTTTDAQLVAGHLAGDRSAFAAIYDRFGDSLYDTAAAMTRDRHDAADVVQDVFVVAAERMEQLRDPDRLKPWLFAILRNEVYRRSGKRRRDVATDFTDSAAEMALPSQPADDASAAEYEELAELVRNAAAGLDARDQLVLEYSVRRDLQGEDLAAALGVSAQQSYGMLHRMRQRAERSLGAYCVARAGRKECAELAQILTGWDGEFSVLIRKRVARHVDQCATCERSRRKLAPIALFGAAPALAAPPELRDRVLGSTAPAHPTYAFGAPGGFPSVVRYGRRLGLWFLVALLFLLLAGGTAVVVLARGDGADLVATDDVTAGTSVAAITTTRPPTSVASLAVPIDEAAAGVVTTVEPAGATAPDSSTTATSSSTTTTVPATTTTTIAVSAPVTAGVPLSTTTTVPSTTTTPPTTPATTPPTTTPATTPPTTPPTTPSTTPPTTTPPTLPPGELTLSSGSIDFGTDVDRARVRLTNTGGQPLDWSSTTGPAAFRGNVTPYSVAPGSGSLTPGESVDVFVLIDRTWPIEGPVQPTRLTFFAPGTTAEVALAAAIARDPVIDASRTPSSICANSPSGARNRLPAIAAVVDESTPLTVRYDAVNQRGDRVGQAMTLRNGEWFASIDMSGFRELDHVWSWTIVAADPFGNATRTTGVTEIIPTFC